MADKKINGMNLGDVDSYSAFCLVEISSISREYGISLAEIARRVGGCTSAIAKGIQEKERQMSEV